MKFSAALVLSLISLVLLGSCKGAVAGGFIVALIESFAAGYFFAAYRDVVVFALLIMLLIFRPQGIFGDA